MKKTKLGRYLATGLLTIACSMQMVFPSLAVNAADILKESKLSDAIQNSLSQNSDSAYQQLIEEANKSYGLMATLNAQGEVAGYSLAYPIEINNMVMVNANTDAVVESSEVYVWITNQEELYETTQVTYEPEDHVLITAAKEGTDNPCLPKLASAHQGEHAYLVHMTEDWSEYQIVHVQMEDARAFDDSGASAGLYFAFLNVNGIPNQNIAFPAAIYNENYECIAIAYESAYVVSYSTPQSEFYSTAVTPEPEDPTPIETQPATQPAGEPTTQPTPQPTTQPAPQPTPQTDPEPDTTKYFLMGVIVILAVVLIVTNSNKKNGNRNPYDSSDSRTISLGESVHQDTGVKLVGVGGYMDGKTFPVGSHEITFGRDSSCGIQYPADAQGISRVHCKLYWQNGTLMLMDMNSSYGTFTETGKLEPMRPVPVKYGDVFFLSQKNNAFMIQ